MAFELSKPQRSPHTWITVAAFTIARLSSQYRSPSETGWIKKSMVCTHIRLLKNNHLSSIGKSVELGIMPFGIHQAQVNSYPELSFICRI